MFFAPTMAKKGLRMQFLLFVSFYQAAYQRMQYFQRSWYDTVWDIKILETFICASPPSILPIIRRFSLSL